MNCQVRLWTDNPHNDNTHMGMGMLALMPVIEQVFDMLYLL